MSPLHCTLPSAAIFALTDLLAYCSLLLYYGLQLYPPGDACATSFLWALALAAPTVLDAYWLMN